MQDQHWWCSQRVVSCDCALLILSQNWQNPSVWVRQEKKLKTRVPLMPSHGLKYFFFIIRWPQFGVLHGPLSSLYTGLSARIHNPWVSLARLSIFWIIKWSFWGMLRTTPKHNMLLLYPMISTRYTRKRVCLGLHPLQRIPKMEDCCRSPSRHPTCIDRPQSEPAAISHLYNQLVEIPSNAAYKNLKYIKFQSITVYLQFENMSLYIGWQSMIVYTGWHYIK